MKLQVQSTQMTRRARSIATILALFLITHCAEARINVVTLPGRDSVQLTIYNSVDLTLVRETRVLTFRKGLNRLEFSWANTLIDPTSVELRAVTHPDELDVLDVSFPARVSNTLEWRIKSDFAGEVQIEIRYFTSGIRWSADYLAEAARNEKLMNLAGNVRVTNNSGEDYENAQLRLVVGVIRLVEEIAELARRDRSGEAKKALAWSEVDGDLRQKAQRGLNERFDDFERRAGRKNQIVKEGLSEYFLYTVEGRDTIPDGWSKRLPSFQTADVPITSVYKFEREQWGEQVMRYYRFTNSVPDKLGREPLPDGAVKAFRFVTDDQLYGFVGSTAVKYIPVNEQVDLDLGPDLEVQVAPKLMNWQKTDIAFDNWGNIKGWTIKESWQIEVQNSKEIDALVDVRRNFSGDWSIDTQAKYETVDAAKIKFLVPLKPGQKQTLSYTLTTRQGSNATR